jgi:hypothetical protein
MPDLNRSLLSEGENADTLGGLTDVTITGVAAGDFLKYNGSVWLNDVIDLGTDTTGNYIATISGTANEITVTGSGSESAAVTLSLPANVTISNNLVVTGDLTVSGNTVTLNTANLNVEDNFILLNSGVTGSPTLNAGVEIERGTSTNVAIRWNESTDKWEFTNDGETYSELGSGGGAEPTETTITTNSVTTIDSFDKSTADSAEFTVKITQGDRRYSSKSLALHNGTTVDLVQYGELSIGATEVEAVAGSGAITWVTQTSNFGSTSINSVAYGNNLWVAGGGGYAALGEIRTSTDAITWTTRTSNFGSTAIRSVAFANSLWVAAGYAGQLRTSTDAITWVTRTSNFSEDFLGRIISVAYGNNLWVAGGYYGQLRTSAAEVGSPSFVEIPLTLSADISGSDVRLLATITDAATTNAEVKVLKTAL